MTRSDNADRILAGLAEVLEIAEGRAKPARLIVPAKVDVKAIRQAQGLTQGEFARAYGFSLAAVRDWEQERRTPEASARVLLKVIQHRPDAVREAMGA